MNFKFANYRLCPKPYQALVKDLPGRAPRHPATARTDYIGRDQIAMDRMCGLRVAASGMLAIESGACGGSEKRADLDVRLVGEMTESVSTIARHCGASEMGYYMSVVFSFPSSRQRSSSVQLRAARK